jgi:hypothetical protein
MQLDRWEPLKTGKTGEPAVFSNRRFDWSAAMLHFEKLHLFLFNIQMIDMWHLNIQWL